MHLVDKLAHNGMRGSTVERHAHICIYRENERTRVNTTNGSNMRDPICTCARLYPRTCGHSDWDIKTR
eukprot:8935762-Pyramimonas_sp.AAC.1